jgi:ABC-2 type transport system permease protein
MAWAVFKDTLWHSRIGTFLWGLGLALIMAVSVLATPSLASMDMVDLMASFPPWMMSFLGMSDAEIIASPNGLVALGFFGKLALLVAAYPVVMGLRVTAGEESDGMMDVVLSQPVPRWRVLMEKFLAYCVTISIVMGMTIGGVFLGSLGIVLPDDVPPLEPNVLALVTLSIIPVMIFLLALTAFIGTLVRHYRTAMALITAYVIASFAFQIVGPMAGAGQDWFNIAKNFFVFNYFGVENTLKHGLSAWNVAVMLGMAALFVGASLYRWEQRDIAV